MHSDVVSVHIKESGMALQKFLVAGVRHFESPFDSGYAVIERDYRDVDVAGPVESASNCSAYFAEVGLIAGDGQETRQTIVNTEMRIR